MQNSMGQNAVASSLDVLQNRQGQDYTGLDCTDYKCCSTVLTEDMRVPKRSIGTGLGESSVQDVMDTMPRLVC